MAWQASCPLLSTGLPDLQPFEALWDVLNLVLMYEIRLFMHIDTQRREVKSSLMDGYCVAIGMELCTTPAAVRVP